ncbi:MAG TPA: hypothetical protein VFZ95_13845 [Steroidobacteraceae bacterium]
MKIQAVLTALLLGTANGTACAQDMSEGGWHFLVEPYAMFPNMKGETGIGNLPPVHVDQDPQDIFSHLQMGAMLFLEARNQDWALSSDLLYMDLEADIEQETLIAGGRVGVSQLGWELAALRRIAPAFELGLGLTYNKIDADLDVDVLALIGPDYTLSGKLTEEWIDPTIVARATFPFGDKWFFQARANLGGFGIGSASDLNWQLQADVGYRPSEKWRFSFGYRLIDIDYDQGSNGDRFVYDVRTFGPVLRLGYSF